MCSRHRGPAPTDGTRVLSRDPDEQRKIRLMLRLIFSVGPVSVLPVVAVLIKAQSGSQRGSEAR